MNRAGCANTPSPMGRGRGPSRSDGRVRGTFSASASAGQYSHARRECPSPRASRAPSPEGRGLLGALLSMERSA
jgi:hypothetical protein